MRLDFSVLKAPLFSPAGLLLRAALLAASFAVCHALGFREYTTILCGTAPAGTSVASWQSIAGVLYIFFYFGFVLGAPIMLLSAALFAGAMKFGRTSR